MKHIKIYEEEQNIEQNKQTCADFLTFVHKTFSNTSNFVKAYNETKDYDEHDEIIYVFDGIDNMMNDENSTLQKILSFMRGLGWYDENFEIVPIMEDNKLYVCFYLGHSYDEMRETVLKNDVGKYNL